MSAIKKKALLRNISKLGLEPVAEEHSNSAFIKSKAQTDCKNCIPGESSIQRTEAECSLNETASSIFSIQEVFASPESGISFKTYYSPPKTSESPIYICHHGAGSSSMTFFCLSKSLRRLGEDGNVPGVFAFDTRGHGMPNGCIDSYTLEDLTKDFHFIMTEFSRRHNPPNPLFMVGHSLGGAVISNFVYEFPQLDYNIKGLVIIDIVEETAIQSLQSIRFFLDKRPNTFHSIKQAVQWHLHSRLLRNEESAKISVPNLLIRTPEGLYTWKASIGNMAKSWDTWFKDLSSKFLQCNFQNHKLSKLLILSSNETLDKQLTIGQMQGKFQLVVFNNSTNAGHFLHEDIPDQIAASLTDFARRYSVHNNYQRNTSLWGGKINP